MIYGQDEPMLFPVADLYDSGMMQMYINAAREQYNQARDDMKEFSKLYGDFFSPFSKDMEWVDAQTRGRVNDALNYMQANGIDPLRSAEGRALVSKIIRDTNVAGINQRRANAKMAEEYIKNRGTMIANGTYNPDYENYLLAQMGLGRFEDFDSSMGAWTRTSPAKYQDLNAATSSWFDDLKGEDLGLDPTGKYRMFGVNEDQLQRSMTPMLPGFVHTDLGGYYYNLAKKQLQAEGNAAPSEDEVLNRLRSGIVGANKEKMYTKYDTDDYAKMQQQHRYELAEDKAKTANDVAAHRKKAEIDREMLVDANMDGKISEEEIKDYKSSVKEQQIQKKKQSGSYLVLDEARDRSDINGGFGYGYYTPGKEVQNFITPADPNVEYVQEDKKNGTQAQYKMTRGGFNRVMFAASDVENGVIPRRLQLHEDFLNDSVYFFPNGQVRAVRDRSGNIHYYLLGTVEHSEGGELSNGATYAMEIKRQKAKVNK